MPHLIIGELDFQGNLIHEKIPSECLDIRFGLNPCRWHLQGSRFGQQSFSKSQAVGHGRCFYFLEAEPVFLDTQNKQVLLKIRIQRDKSCAVIKT